MRPSRYWGVVDRTFDLAKMRAQGRLSVITSVVRVEAVPNSSRNFEEYPVSHFARAKVLRFV